jgi:hypothetical protein
MKVSTCLSTSPASFDAAPFTGDFKHNAARIADLGFDNLGMLLDTFHMNIEEPSIEESITMTGSRIFHSQTKREERNQLVGSISERVPGSWGKLRLPFEIPRPLGRNGGTKCLGSQAFPFGKAACQGQVLDPGFDTFHFHYADSNRWYPGAGHLNFPSILEALYRTGYTGYVSGEHRPDTDPLTAAREGLRYLRNLEKQLGL